MNRNDIEQIAASMSEEEMRARAEAAAIGQWRILEAAIAALIMTSPHAEVVKSAILGTLGDLEHEKPEHPSLAWAPPAVHAGAKAAAGRILELHESVKTTLAKRTPN